MKYVDIDTIKIVMNYVDIDIINNIPKKKR